jgi:hypothetical protein
LRRLSLIQPFTPCSTSALAGSGARAPRSSQKNYSEAPTSMMKESPHNIYPQVGGVMRVKNLPVTSVVTRKKYSRVLIESPHKIDPRVPQKELPMKHTRVADDSSLILTCSSGHRCLSPMRHPHRHSVEKRLSRRTSRVMQPLPAAVFETIYPNLNINRACIFRPRG